VYGHFGLETFRHYVFGAEASHICALVPKCPKCLGQFGTKVHETLQTQNKNGPMLRVCYKRRPTLYSLLWWNEGAWKTTNKSCIWLDSYVWAVTHCRQRIGWKVEECNCSEQRWDHVYDVSADSRQRRH